MKDRLATILLSVASTFGVMQVAPDRQKTLDVDRLIVRKELIVSDTGEPWEKGFETQQMPRGIYARSLFDGPGGLWVRSRLIKGEIDDPFDDRFHALERDGSLRLNPGHISWNVWLDGNWRQMAIVQGEGLEYSELPRKDWNGGSHPGRIRIQSFRPNHGEPLTDAIIGQGKMVLGGGGFGGSGMPDPQDVLHLVGGDIRTTPIRVPAAPAIVKDDGTGEHRYAIIAVGAQGKPTNRSPETTAKGYATINWKAVTGADAYIVVRDGKEITGPLRIEGSPRKEWVDRGK